MEHNKAQEKVISTIEGQMIVIACPGSGKTTTLLKRIDHMVHSGIDPENILMITFTSAAAKEMKERYARQYRTMGVTFCTIHALCLAILRKFSKLGELISPGDVSQFFYNQLRQNRSIKDKNEFINNLITDISVIKNNPSEKIMPTCTEDTKLFQKLYQSYEDHKTKMGMIDFDDMLIQAYELMQENEECLKWLRGKYRYIQVDEYQDTNFLQRDIIYLLAGEKGNLAVVGDDDQSIYGFRGARPEVMLNFSKDYPDTKIIRMGTNYRSCKRIIQAADLVIRKNKKRYQKEFQAFKERPGLVRIIMFETSEMEMDSISSCIKKAGWGNTAILFRTNRQAEQMAFSLINAGIPFVSNEKIPSCYEHWIFRDIQAYYQVANQHFKSQDLYKVFSMYFLADPAYLEVGLDRKKLRRRAYLLNKEEWKRNRALESITEMLYTVQKLKGKSPSEFMKILFLDYERYLKDYAKYRNTDIEELKAVWKRIETDAKKYNDWKEWGRYILKYNATIKNAQQNESGVVLSTMHCSKGLEWDTVYIIDCVEGITPFKKAVSEDAIEEERRLFYVAMTRAKESLYLCSYKGKPESRFIKEMRNTK